MYLTRPLPCWKFSRATISTHRNVTEYRLITSDSRSKLVRPIVDGTKVIKRQESTSRLFKALFITRLLVGHLRPVRLHVRLPVVLRSAACHCHTGEGYCCALFTKCLWRSWRYCWLLLLWTPQSAISQSPARRTRRHLSSFISVSVTYGNPANNPPVSYNKFIVVLSYIITTFWCVNIMIMWFGMCLSPRLWFVCECVVA